MKQTKEITFPADKYQEECRSEDHMKDIELYGSCLECHGIQFTYVACAEGTRPHTFEVEDQGEQVDLKCIFCGKISKE